MRTSAIKCELNAKNIHLNEPIGLYLVEQVVPRLDHESQHHKIYRKGLQHLRFFACFQPTVRRFLLT